MENIKEHRHLGSYAIIINNESVLLIRKKGGPYDGKLDLPGGTIEFNERPSSTLIRELREEVGVSVKEYKLLDVDSVSLEWIHNNKLIKTHHIGIFYEVLKYVGEIKNNIAIDNVNDDSLGANYYKISELRKEDLSSTALLELQKKGYHFK